jgi:hypothetical protein
MTQIQNYLDKERETIAIGLTLGMIVGFLLI